ncbi:MAG: pirin-like C-terminal cupin domain-containing protein [Pseudomonadota bacterium]|nr:pirin-like C-terminal cupin domain-containing protein [Pseudomonadota bacterium]
MEKKVIGVTRAPTIQSVGQAYQEHVFFNYRGLGRQANPAILASYAPAQNVAPAGTQPSTGARAHSGFECVTLLLQGQLEARDSAGHAHTLAAGDVLWSGAGRGLLCEQRHGADLAREGGTLELINFWINLPAACKATDPHCQHLDAASLPELPLPGDAGSMRVIAGEWQEQLGPAETVTPLQLWDLRLRAGRSVKLPLPLRWYGLLLVLQGRVRLSFWQQAIDARQLVLLDGGGDELAIEADHDTRAVLLCSQPLDEPIVGADALVLNTEEQLAQAQRDVQSGAFGTLPDVA